MVKLTTYAIIALTVQIATNAFQIGRYTQNELTNYGRDIKKHLPESDILKLEQALSNDPFFSGMIKEKILGAGSYGLVFKMNKMVSSVPKSYAVKIGNTHKLIESKGPFPEALLDVDPAELNNWISGERFSEILRNYQTPYLPLLLGIRSIVFKDDIPERNQGQNRLIHKFVQANELARYGDMGHFSRVVQKNHSDSRDSIFLNLFYKSALSLARINGQGIIHGDLKPENIFVKQCDDISELKICPIVGDWDLGYKYDPEAEPSEAQLRYTLYYRPIEMLYFTGQDNNDIKRGSFGYIYSGKEDVYALGITMLDFIFRMGLGLNDINIAFKNILRRMIHPMDIDLVPNFLIGDHETRINWLYKYINSASQLFDRSYASKKREFDATIKTVLTSKDQNNFLKQRIQAIEQGQYHRLVSFYDLLKNAAGKEQKSNGDYCLDVIDEETYNSFVDLYTELRLLNPFQESIDQRPTMKQVVDELTKILYRTEDTNLNDTIAGLYAQILLKESQSAEVDPSRSDVIVFADAYDVNYQRLKHMCRNASILSSNSGAAYQPIVYGQNRVATYTVNEWCSNINASEQELLAYRAKLQEMKQIQASQFNVFSPDREEGQSRRALNKENYRKERAKSNFGAASQANQNYHLPAFGGIQKLIL